MSDISLPVNRENDTRIVRNLMLRLLPLQILLAVVGMINSIISSLFASNWIGTQAMSAVGLYSPINLLVISVSCMLVGGSAILFGTYMGRSQREKVQSVFSLDMAVSLVTGALFALILIVMAVNDLTVIFTSDQEVRQIFNSYIIGQAIGIIPLILGNQMTSFLSLENRTKRSTIASIVFIVLNLIFNLIFVSWLELGAFGLSLASSLGMWAYFVVQAQYYFTDESELKITFRNIEWRDMWQIVKIGFPGAAINIYQTIRGFIVNGLMLTYVGSVGVSAFAACNTFLGLFWCMPTGMAAVIRMMLSVSTGEEDRKSTADVTRVVLKVYLPIMAVVSLILIIFAEPITQMYYRDMSDPVYMMTVWGFRLLPIAMPLAVLVNTFVCYGQVTDKLLFLHIISLLDGVINVCLYTFLLIGTIGMNAVYVANVLNGLTSLLYILIYAVIRNRHVPRNMDELMVMPQDFGVPEEDRMDITLTDMDQVVKVSEAVQGFCLKKGADTRRSYFAGLSLEEMAGNVVTHGFNSDNKKHSIDLRVVSKDDDIILRIRDDCMEFDPLARLDVMDPEDITKNIGIRLIYDTARHVYYQSILGLNVLTIRI
ncbi:MAG: ATP-binding protein [Lachnospiraceae bacterium]|nr:ATP-binding protein [Lachnospiraceae bacterium]